MYSKVFAFVCIQLAVFNAATSQCINRLPTETIIPANPCPNQIFVNPNPCNNPIFFNPINPCPNQILLNQNPAIVETIYPAPMPTTTIIQDSSVANNLANALQLLVVSNLLSNTLPVPGQVEVLPSYSPAVEILPACAPQTLEVVQSYAAPVEFIAPGCGCASQIASAAPCGCGYGFNYVF